MFSNLQRKILRCSQGDEGTDDEEIIYEDLGDDASDEDILKHFKLEYTGEEERDLVLSCWKGDLSKVINFNEQFWRVSINEPINKRDDTFLHLAMQRNNSNVVKFLLEKDAINAFVKNKKFQSPIGSICQCSSCKIKSSESAKEYFKYILSKRDLWKLNPNFQEALHDTILHSQKMAEIVVEKCWNDVASPSDNQPKSFIQQCRRFKERKITTDRIAEAPAVKEYKYLIGEILKKYPNMVDMLISKLDKQIEFSDFNHSIDTAETELDLKFELLMANKTKTELSLSQDSAVQETELLMELVGSNKTVRKKILDHPLVQAFIHLKWQRFRRFAWISIIFYVLLAVMMTMYVLNVQLGKCRVRPDLTQTRELNATIYKAHNRTIVELFQLLQKPPLLLPHSGKEFCKIGARTYSFQLVILILVLIMMTLEVIELLIDDANWGYFRDIRNWFQWAYILCAGVTLIPVYVIESPEFSYWQYQAAGFGLLIVWSLLLMQVSKIQTLAIYIDMLFKVIQNFTRCMMAFSCLIIGFLLGNLVLFSNLKPTETIPRAILKTLAGIAGEFSYQDDFYRDVREVEGKLKNKHFLLYPISSHIFYVLFVVICAMALMNLLIGLAVDDVEKIRRDAEANTMRRMTKEIYYLEKFIHNLRCFLPVPFHKCLVNCISLVKEDEMLGQEKKTCVMRYSHEDPNSDRANLSWTIRIRPHSPESKEIPEKLKIRIFEFAKKKMQEAL